MIKLYLDNTEVFPTAKQTITVTKENPYFTLSDSYTLEVEIPLDIPENRKFFLGVERLDTTKAYRTYDALMVSAIGVLLKGKARLARSTEAVVRLQVTMGISAVKMIADNDNLYIDEMNLGYCPEGGLRKNLSGGLDEGVRYDAGDIASGGKEPCLSSFGIPFVDTTNDVAVNIASRVVGNDLLYIVHRDYVSMCPNLIDVIRNVFLKLGYTLDMSILPEAVQHLYIVTGIHSDYAAPKLPHWTVAKFLEEVQNFFACVIVRDGDHALKMVSVKDYTKNHVSTIEPSASFEVNYTEGEDVNGLINCNVAFSIDGGDTEVVADDILKSAKNTEFHATYADALWSYKDASDKDMAKRTIYNVNGGLYIGWEDGTDSVELKRIAPFNALVRYEGAETVELSICPSVMVEDYAHRVTYGSVQNEITLNLISVNNPLPVRKRTFVDSQGEEETTPTLQQLVEGEESLTAAAEKLDIMPVAFLGSSRLKVDVSGPANHSISTNIALGFTDSKFKREPGLSREPWTLSLQDLTDYEFCLGKMHKLPFEINRKARHCFKFLSDSVPEATDIFYCRGKKYACEKIEVSIVDGEVSKLMTGYFYEIVK